MSEMPRHIVVSATFTADQINDVIGFWALRLNASVEAVIAPYGQVYQQLLDPYSDLRCNRVGANVLLVRWKDLAVALPQAYARAARELTDAVLSMDSQVPMLIVLCPEDSREADAAEANEIFKNAVSGSSTISVIDAAVSFSSYNVSQAYDHLTERTGHIPYTQEAMTSIGTSIFRWWDYAQRKPVKVLALDCDNTLWAGVVGEDGEEGLRIADGHRCLQKKLINQTDKGRVLTVFSKNREEDVLAVFRNRPEMLLGEEHIVSRRINWLPKPVNLIEVTAELNLGLDSVLFLDDSMVECAEMRARCPEVMTVQIPADDAQFRSFTDHLWLFDQQGVTAEDKSRAQMYKDQTAREASRRDAVSLSEFFKTLELEVAIDQPDTDQLERFSQLTQRTNQFNASMERVAIEELQQDLGDDGTTLRIISAKDRFGDYGIVGAMRAQSRNDKLVADIFLLSCRALGRGIEHKMIAELGKVAVDAGLRKVAVVYDEGPRNQPAKQFLVGLSASENNLLEEGRLVLLAETAMGTVFTPAASSSEEVVFKKPNPLIGDEPWKLGSGLTYQSIALELTTAKAIIDAMRGRVQERPELATGYVAPSSIHEKALANIWEEVLRVTPIGSRDSFFDLGGKSIQLVQIHSLVQKRLSIEFDFTAMFEHGTIASLAKSLGSLQQQGHSAFSAVNRAQKMRQARDRRAAAHRQQREAAS